jgi:hypothetical protein
VSTAEVIGRILSEHKHPEHGYRRCLGNPPVFRSRQK